MQKLITAAKIVAIVVLLGVVAVMVLIAQSVAAQIMSQSAATALALAGLAGSILGACLITRPWTWTR